MLTIIHPFVIASTGYLPDEVYDPDLNFNRKNIRMFTCHSNSTLNSCSILSPWGKSYDILKAGENLTCFHDHLQMCAEIREEVCIIYFKSLQEMFIGRWQCAFHIHDTFVREEDAMVMRRAGVLHGLHVFDSFNITPALLKGEDNPQNHNIFVYNYDNHDILDFV